MKQYIMKVVVDHSLERVFRTLVIPGDMTVDQLACTIIASLNGYGSYPYHICLKDKVYISDDLFQEENEIFASEVSLEQIDIKPNDCFLMIYDPTERYEFEIEVLDCSNVEASQVAVLDGQGGGIVEDCRMIFENYYLDLEKDLTEFLNHLQLTLDETGVLEEFDLDECNAKLNERIQKCQEIFEESANDENVIYWNGPTSMLTN